MSMSVDQWVEIAKECQYLPENDLKVSVNIILRDGSDDDV